MTRTTTAKTAPAVIAATALAAAYKAASARIDTGSPAFDSQLAATSAIGDAWSALYESLVQECDTDTRLAALFAWCDNRR